MHERVADEERFSAGSQGSCRRTPWQPRHAARDRLDARELLRGFRWDQRRSRRILTVVEMPPVAATNRSGQRSPSCILRLRHHISDS